METERNYKIEIFKLSDEDGGGFLAEVPALSGCMSDGETQEEALANVKDAIKCWIETAEENGRSIPCEDGYKEEENYSGKLTLRIPKFLHKQISNIADKEGCSINQLLTSYISIGLGIELDKKQLKTSPNNDYNNDRPSLIKYKGQHGIIVSEEADLYENS